MNHYTNDYFLAHYGVKGMRWGHRKKYPVSETRAKYDSAKAAYKSAKKTYNKAFDDAYNYSSVHPVGQFTSKKKKVESDRRWDTAIDKAHEANAAQNAYKQAKKERKNQLENARKQVSDSTSIGEKLFYGGATRDKAAKYVVDNNMSVADAKKKASKDAIRNTAIILGAYGAVKMSRISIQDLKDYADVITRAF